MNQTDAISRSRVLDTLEAEKRRLMGGRGCDWPFTGEVLAKAVETVIDFIKQVPAIDAVPVVRCKDCAHWKPCEVKGFEGKMYCEWAGWLVGENAYCVYGEVKNND